MQRSTEGPVEGQCHPPEDPYGLGHKPGGAHYRAYVGPPADYDLIAGLQFSLLFTLGLRETHMVADVGCGSLRAGRLLIPYLRAGHYFGVEPNFWLVEQGVERELGQEFCAKKQPTFSRRADFDLREFGLQFDFIMAHSIFSHTYTDLLRVALPKLAASLAPQGLLVATFIERDEPTSDKGSGWLYPGCVYYRPEQLHALMDDLQLVSRKLDWPHPRQSWYLIGHASAQSLVDSRARAVRGPGI
jgi:SAM-dependent methyltransferase